MSGLYLVFTGAKSGKFWPSYAYQDSATITMRQVIRGAFNQILVQAETNLTFSGAQSQENAFWVCAASETFQVRFFTFQQTKPSARGKVGEHKTATMLDQQHGFFTPRMINKGWICFLGSFG
jgi:hypothetical protein